MNGQQINELTQSMMGGGMVPGVGPGGRMQPGTDPGNKQNTLLKKH